MLDSRSSACRIPDNDKVRDSLKASNPPHYIVIFQALGEMFVSKKTFRFDLSLQDVSSQLLEEFPEYAVSYSVESSYFY